MSVAVLESLSPDAIGRTMGSPSAYTPTAVHVDHVVGPAVHVEKSPKPMKGDCHSKKGDCYNKKPYPPTDCKQSHPTGCGCDAYSSSSSWWWYVVWFIVIAVLVYIFLVLAKPDFILKDEKHDHGDHNHKSGKSHKSYKSDEVDQAKAIWWSIGIAIVICIILAVLFSCCGSNGWY